MKEISTGDVSTQVLFSGKPGIPLCFIDTSTLIYLDRLELLERVVAVFSVATIAGVIREFGRSPERIAVYSTGKGATDLLLVKRAALCNAVVFSEDKKVLQDADRHGLEYYNTLMIVLALYARREIDIVACASLLTRLESFARYSANVWDYGSEVLAALQSDGETISMPPPFSGK